MARHLHMALVAVMALVAMTAGEAAGQTYEVVPGQLAAECAVPSRAGVITVTGSVDASDLAYLAATIEELHTLDLSGVTVAAYRGPRVGANVYSAPADVLPPYILAGLRAAHVRLPASITAIGEGALMDSRIEEVVIPQGVTRVGADAFAQCRRLTRAELSEGMATVEARTFEGCGLLADVSLPGSLSAIGDRAFLGCRSLGEIAMPESLTCIGHEAFALSGLERVSLDGCGRLASVGERAFASCARLVSATLPSGAAELGEGVFFDCESLADVRLPSEAVSVPALALKGAVSLASVNLPDGVSEIGVLAMAGMTAVETVALPASLTHIGDGAFEGWSGVREIDALRLETVPSLGDEVWAGVEQPAVTLNVLPELEEAFLAAPQWQEFSISRSSITLLPSTSGGVGHVEAGFTGMTLRVSSDTELESVTLYGVDGRVLETAVHIGADSVSLDTSRHAGAFFIVRAETRDGSRGVTFKLMRQP